MVSIYTAVDVSTSRSTQHIACATVQEPCLLVSSDGMFTRETSLTELQCQGSLVTAGRKWRPSGDGAPTPDSFNPAPEVTHGILFFFFF